MEAGAVWLLKITTLCAMSCGIPPTPGVCGANCGTPATFYERRYDLLREQEAGGESHRSMYASLALCTAARKKWAQKTPEGITLVAWTACVKTYAVKVVE